MANHSSETDIHIKEVSKVNKALNDTLDIIDGNMLNLEREVKAVQKVCLYLVWGWETISYWSICTMIKAFLTFIW